MIIGVSDAFVFTAAGLFFTRQQRIMFNCRLVKPQGERTMQNPNNVSVQLRHLNGIAFRKQTLRDSDSAATFPTSQYQRGFLSRKEDGVAVSAFQSMRPDAAKVHHQGQSLPWQRFRRVRVGEAQSETHSSPFSGRVRVCNNRVCRYK